MCPFDPSKQINVGNVLEEINPPASVFDMSEAQGLKVVDALTKCVNNSFTTKPIGNKLNLLYDKYQTIKGKCTPVERTAAQGSLKRLSYARSPKSNIKDWSSSCTSRQECSAGEKVPKHLKSS